MRLYRFASKTFLITMRVRLLREGSFAYDILSVFLVSEIPSSTSRPLFAGLRNTSCATGRINTIFPYVTDRGITLENKYPWCGS
jgi:hypothetical protein